MMNSSKNSVDEQTLDSGPHILHTTFGFTLLLFRCISFDAVEHGAISKSIQPSNYVCHLSFGFRIRRCDARMYVIHAPFQRGQANPRLLSMVVETTILIVASALEISNMILGENVSKFAHE